MDARDFIILALVVALAWLLIHHRRRVAASAPVRTPDHPAPVPEPHAALASGLHRDVLLKYRDAAGHVTDRRLTVHSVQGDSKSHPVYVDGYCHLQSAPRTFRIDRIVQLADAATGEVFRTPLEGVAEIMKSATGS